MSTERGIEQSGWTVYKNARIYTPEAVIDKGVLLVDADGIILEIGKEWLDLPEAEAARSPHVDVAGLTILPGLIDIHVHGGGGFEMMDGTQEGLIGMSRFHIERGTTSFLATTTTGSHERIVQALNNASVQAKSSLPGAEMVGIHLEGPFLHPKRCGGQNPAFLRQPHKNELAQFIQASGNMIKVVTIAPELEGGMDAVRWLSEQGITVSIGHSDATFEQVREAMRYGAKQTTHHFNGMSPFRHRAPGIAGAGLILPELTVELIADGVHVHPAIAKWMFDMKGAEGICLITDAVVCAGLPDGHYGRRVVVDGLIYLHDLSCLSGSSLGALQALKNMIEFTGYPLEIILPSMTEVPARQIGINKRKGSMSPGKDADFLIVDDQFKLHAAYVRGKKVFEARPREPDSSKGF